MTEADWRDSFRELFADYGTPWIFLRNGSWLCFIGPASTDYHEHEGNDPDIEIPEGAYVRFIRRQHGESPFLLARKLTDFHGEFKEFRAMAAEMGETIVQWFPRTYPYPTGNCVLSGDVEPFSEEDLQEAIDERRALLITCYRKGMAVGECSLTIIENMDHYPTLIFPRTCRLTKEKLPRFSETSGPESLDDFFYCLQDHLLRKLD